MNINDLRGSNLLIRKSQYWIMWVIQHTTRAGALLWLYTKGLNSLSREMSQIWSAAPKLEINFINRVTLMLWVSHSAPYNRLMDAPAASLQRLSSDLKMMLAALTWFQILGNGSLLGCDLLTVCDLTT